MSDDLDIKGGAGEFEAAVLAVVIDHIRFEQRSRAEGRNQGDNRVPAWVRALRPDLYRESFDHKRPIRGL